MISRQSPSGHPATMRGRDLGALLSLSLAQFTTTLEFTVMFIALPSIGRDLALDPSTLQWVASAYAVVFGGFLILGGRLSDRIGSRLLFLFAVILFALASAVGAGADSGTVLLGARAVQGLAAAMLQPAVLGLLQARFATEPARSRAWAVWAAIGASGLGAGALLGGLLTAVSWRLTFAINIPLMIICAVGTALWIVPDDRRSSVRVPAVAAGLGVGAALTLVLGLTMAPEYGWASRATWAWLAVAGVLAAAFACNETDPSRALVEHRLRRVASLWTGAGATACYMASVGSAYYLLTLLLQFRWGYSALDAGLAFLPLATAVAAGSGVAGRGVRELGLTRVLLTGFVLAACGLGWLAAISDGRSYLLLLIGLLVSGFGNGLIFTSMFMLGTRDISGADRGTAGGVLATSQYLSSTLALAVITLVLGQDLEPHGFQRAFLLLTAAAISGFVLVLVRHRRTMRLR